MHMPFTKDAILSETMFKNTLSYLLGITLAVLTPIEPRKETFSEPILWRLPSETEIKQPFAIRMMRIKNSLSSTLTVRSRYSATDIERYDINRVMCLLLWAGLSLSSFLPAVLPCTLGS